jgi:hypothetical protein
MLTCAVLGLPITARAQTVVWTPSSPAGVLLKQWLDMFNVGDSVGLEAFTVAHCPTCKAAAWMRRYRELGGFVLLYKAKAPSPKDNADFRAVPSHLQNEQRWCLREALDMTAPGHHWADLLSREA